MCIRDSISIFIVPIISSLPVNPIEKFPFRIISKPSLKKLRIGKVISAAIIKEQISSTFVFDFVIECLKFLKILAIYLFDGVIHDSSCFCISSLFKFLPIKTILLHFLFSQSSSSIENLLPAK